MPETSRLIRSFTSLIFYWLLRVIATVQLTGFTAFCAGQHTNVQTAERKPPAPNSVGFSLALQKCFKKSNCTETARQETGKDEGEGKGGLVESLLVSKLIFVYLVALFLFLKLYYCSAVIIKELR